MESYIGIRYNHDNLFSSSVRFCMSNFCQKDVMHNDLTTSWGYESTTILYHLDWDAENRKSPPRSMLSIVHLFRGKFGIERGRWASKWVPSIFFFAQVHKYKRFHTWLRLSWWWTTERWIKLGRFRMCCPRGELKFNRQSLHLHESYRHNR